MTRSIKKRSVVTTLKKKSGLSRTRKATLKKKPIQDIKSVSYQSDLIESLKVPTEAAAYLNAALSGGDIKVFLLALQNVIQAQGGIAGLTKKTHKKIFGFFLVTKLINVSTLIYRG